MLLMLASSPLVFSCDRAYVFCTTSASPQFLSVTDHAHITVGHRYRNLSTMMLMYTVQLDARKFESVLVDQCSVVVNFSVVLVLSQCVLSWSMCGKYRQSGKARLWTNVFQLGVTHLYWSHRLLFLHFPLSVLSAVCTLCSWLGFYNGFLSGL